MGIFPTTAGVRPRLACELRPGGAVAARSDTPAGLIEGCGAAEFASQALQPGLAVGNITDRAAVAAAIKRALEAAGSSGFGRDVTLIVPDPAVRVILLDFESLPGKLSEALPVVRFRLRKLVPFDVDNASVSYQIMSSTRHNVQVLVVAMPSDVVAEYESVVREAGFEPGALLPSTLASVAGLQDAESSALVVNASMESVTTAIVQNGLLLLHRPVELRKHRHVAVSVPGPMPEQSMIEQPGGDPHEEHDPIEAAALLQTQQLQHIEQQESAAHDLNREISQAVSVALAYFEDTLGFRPEMVLAAGPIGADGLSAILDGSNIKVREMVEPAAMAAGAASSSVKRGLLAGVRGALRG